MPVRKKITETGRTWCQKSWSSRVKFLDVFFLVKFPESEFHKVCNIFLSKSNNEATDCGTVEKPGHRLDGGEKPHSVKLHFLLNSC